MHDTSAYLLDLGRRGVRLWLEDGVVRYRAPAGSLTYADLDHLRSHRAEIVSLLRGPANACVPAAPAPGSTTGRFPLSFAQERLWFLEQMGAVGPAYLVPLVLRLRGKLSHIALEQSILALLNRHASLRTRIRSQDGCSTQEIFPAAFTLHLEQISAAPGANAESHSSAVRRAIRSHILRPFQVEQGDLFRCALHNVAKDEYVLVIAVHHVVIDGWSMGLLFRDLGHFYSAFSQAREPQLPSLPLQYVDYAIWQRSLIEGLDFQRQLNYWLHQLDGMPQILNLPMDRDRPSMPTFRGASLQTGISGNLLTSLKQLAQQEGVTLFMLLLAAYSILLSRYSGDEQVIIGAPVANRPQKNCENVVGFFVNTIIFRTDLSGDPSFRAYLQRIKDITLGAYANQDLPFELLVSQLRPNRHAAINPLFQVMLAHQAVPDDASIRWHDLEVEVIEPECHTSKFDITLHITERPSRITLTWEYATDLFDPNTIQGMAESNQALLQGIARFPDLCIGALSLSETLSAMSNKLLA